MVIDCFQFSVMSSNYWVMVNDYVRRRAIRKSKSLSCLLRDEIRRAVLLRKMLMSCKSEFSSWPTAFVWAVACNRLWRGGWKLDGLLLCYLQCVLSVDQWRGIHVIIGHVTLCESHTSPFTVRCLKQNAFFCFLSCWCLMSTQKQSTLNTVFGFSLSILAFWGHSRSELPGRYIRD